MVKLSSLTARSLAYHGAVRRLSTAGARGRLEAVMMQAESVL
jgi:hypothetical protein